MKNTTNKLKHKRDRKEREVQQWLRSTNEKYKPPQIQIQIQTTVNTNTRPPGQRRKADEYVERPRSTDANKQIEQMRTRKVLACNSNQYMRR